MNFTAVALEDIPVITSRNKRIGQLQRQLRRILLKAEELRQEYAWLAQPDQPLISWADLADVIDKEIL